MNNINWYPGHMAKAKRLIKEKLPMIDIVLELADARMPKSSKMEDLKIRKPKILVLTKYDICDKKETNKWIEHYEKKGYVVVTMDFNKNINELVETIKKILSTIDAKRASKGLNKRKYRVLVLGVPNVGKSSLINRLVGKKAAKVANKPGVTKGLDWIRINDDLELMDSPGLLWPKFESDEEAYNLSSLTSVREEVLPMDEIALHILKKLENHYPNRLKERYGVLKIDEDIYDIIGKKRGLLIKGGEVDYDKVFVAIINDLKEGRLGKVTFDRYE